MLGFKTILQTWSTSLCYSNFNIDFWSYLKDKNKLQVVLFFRVLMTCTVACAFKSSWLQFFWASNETLPIYKIRKLVFCFETFDE